jgi:hypothetical protein
MRKYSAWDEILEGFKVRILRQMPRSVPCEEESIFESSKWMAFEGGRNKTEGKQPAAGMRESNSYKIRIGVNSEAALRKMEALLESDGTQM